jgi:predicted  nucleic acid-binding Zn-ribbon protein
VEETNIEAHNDGRGPSSDPFRALQECLDALQTQNELAEQRIRELDERNQDLQRQIDDLRSSDRRSERSAENATAET